MAALKRGLTIELLIFLIGTLVIALPIFFAWCGPHSEIVSFQVREAGAPRHLPNI
jgi:hypothetical protein